MDIYNKEKILEIKQAVNDTAKDNKIHKEVIFGVEISMGDNDLNGIVENVIKPEKQSSQIHNLLLHNEEFGIGG